MAAHSTTSQTACAGALDAGARLSSCSGTFIDLFAGCGGLSLGLMTAGWRGLLAVEKDELAFETLAHNLVNRTGDTRYEWPAWFPVSACGIGKFIRRYRTQIAGLRGSIDLIAGGPPCQGFSLAGRRKRADPRNRMFRHYVEIVDLVRPAFLLLENVRGIAVEFGKKRRMEKGGTKAGRPARPFSERIVGELGDLGYRVFPGLVRAVDYGVPQLRPRFIVVGVEGSLVSESSQFDPLELVRATREAFLCSKGLPLDHPVSTREAISDLEAHGKTLVECVDSPGFTQVAYEGPSTHYQKLLHGDMDGTWPNSLRLARHRDEIRSRFAAIQDTCRRGVQLCKRDRERFGLKKRCTVPLDGDRPSHTLTTLPDDLLHYSEPRILTVREYGRLQSFPDWFEFKGKYTTGGDRRVRECPRYTQVGNAVPPFVAEVLGIVLARIRQILCGGRPALGVNHTTTRF